MERTICFVFATISAAAFGAVPQVTTELVAGNLDAPVLATHAGDGSGRLFIVEQTGRIRIFKDGALLPAPFLNISGRLTNGGERGLLGLAFHPDYPSNGRFFVYYTRSGDGASIVSWFPVSPTDPDLAVATSETIVLGPVAQPQANHNAGHIAFGPDGFLYIALGDGGGGGDNDAGHGTIGNGQNTMTLLGSLLRIDVDGGTPYAIPPDNPFADNPTSGQPEIYAWGLRNPWRFSFDQPTGRLFCADVGQDTIEEVDLIVNGGNFGWRVMEGTSIHNATDATNRGGIADLLLPIHEYTQSSGRCSVTGGYVYRGAASPALDGLYFYGDFCTGEIWALEEIAPGTWMNSLAIDTSLRISSFGEDEAGEIYICHHPNTGPGSVYKLVGPPPPAEVQAWKLY